MALVLRPYQEECVAKFIERIDKVQRGGLIVLPTGTGKSAVMAAIAQWWLANRKGGVGIASHRVELMRQNAREYEELTGDQCHREQGADYRATLAEWERIRNGGVISFTVQTLQNRRMSKISRDGLGLILVDEVHRVRHQGQYIRTQEYFGCKWVGLTATPDRTDRQSLIGPMFDECWYNGRLDEFVEQGWLVPPRVQHVHVASLQWQWLKGRSGKDFTNEQVSKVWSDFKSIHEFVAPILKEVGQRKTLYFCPGVPQAKGVADVINSVAHPRRIADYVASYHIDEANNRTDFPKQRRRDILRRFGEAKGELQHVANMGIFTEGTNVPIISAIGWLRITKSRLLLAQGVGRAFRTWPGVLDGLERATAEQRRAAIAASPKPFALIFDPAKVSGKLKLVHVIDLFAQGSTDAVRRRVQEIIKRKAERGEPVDPREVLSEAKELESPFFQGLKAALLEIAPTVEYKLVQIDPYSGRQVGPSPKGRPAERIIGDASQKQKKLIAALSATEFSEEFYTSLSRKQAGAIITKMMEKPCRPWILRKLGTAAKQGMTNSQGLALLKRKASTHA